MDLNLFTAFPVHWLVLPHIHPITHTHTHPNTVGRGCQERCRPAQQEQFGGLVSRPRTLWRVATDPPISGRPVLPSEPQLPWCPSAVKCWAATVSQFIKGFSSENSCTLPEVDPGCRYNDTTNTVIWSIVNKITVWRSFKGFFFFLWYWVFSWQWWWARVCQTYLK